jgi:hypothetical protein
MYFDLFPFYRSKWRQVGRIKVSIMAELMEITLFQTYFNQKCVNRWNYVASGSPAAVTLSFALASAMGFLPVSTDMADGTVGGALQLIQIANVVFNSVLARAVYVDDDFYDSPFISGTAGLVSGASEGLSPLNAYGFFSSRVKQSIGRGYKRFVGVPETATNTGGLMTSGILGQMTTLGGLMGDTLTYDDEGTTLSFVPCIVQKEKYVVTESGKDAYKYYASQATQLVHTAQGIGWSPYENVRSQTSRQYGRGI